MDIYPHISHRVIDPFLPRKDRLKIKNMLLDMHTDCNEPSSLPSVGSDDDLREPIVYSDNDSLGMSIDDDHDGDAFSDRGSKEDDRFSDEEDDRFSGQFKLRRQSSSMIFDPNDIDNVIEQQSNVMVESEQGVLLTLHSEEPSPQLSGVPIYRIDNIVELSKSANSSSSQLRKVNSVSSTSSNHSVSSKRSTMHGRAGYESASKNRIEIVSLHCNTLFSHDLCFTHFQALEYWIQRSDFFLVLFELQTSPSREAKERI